MWSGSGAVDSSGFYHEDPDAFVFNLEKKYIPNSKQHAIINWSKGGIGFGNSILAVIANPINS